MSQLLYGESALGQSVSRADIKALTSSEMRAITALIRDPSSALLVVVSDLELPVVENAVRGWFGSWHVGSPATVLTHSSAVPIAIPKEGPHTIVQDLKGGSQVEVTIACRLPPERLEAPNLNSEAAVVISSWLSTRLRSEAGVTYGVAPAVTSRRGGSSDLTLTFAVNESQFPDALRITHGVWNSVMHEEVDPGVMSQLLWGRTTRNNARFQSSAESALFVAMTITRSSLSDPELGLAEAIGSLNVRSSPRDLKEAFGICEHSAVFAYVGKKYLIDRALAAQK